MNTPSSPPSPFSYCSSPLSSSLPTHPHPHLLPLFHPLTQQCLHTTHTTPPPTHPPTTHDKWNTGVQGTILMHVTFHDGFLRVHGCDLLSWFHSASKHTALQRSHTGIGNHLCLRPYKHHPFFCNFNMYQLSKMVTHL